MPHLTINGVELASFCWVMLPFLEQSKA